MPTSSDRAASGTRTSSFAYDSATGLLTQEVVEPNTSSLRLETDTGYDAFGNKTSVTVSGVDITTRSSTSTYDTKGEFATTNTNALSQSETWQYDARFGKPTSHVGPNVPTPTTWSYDVFGRKTQEVRPDGTQTKWAYLFCSGHNGGTATCPTGGVYLITATPLASDSVTQNGPLGIVYFDVLDREIARDTQGFDASTIRASKQYDSYGRLQQQSRRQGAAADPDPGDHRHHRGGGPVRARRGRLRGHRGLPLHRRRRRSRQRQSRRRTQGGARRRGNRGGVL